MRIFSTAILALLSVGLVASSMQAQATACRGKIIIDTVYQRGTGGQNFEYYFQIRNATNTPMKADVAISNFPGTVALFSPRLPGITLHANENKQIRFGKGTNQSINNGTVRFQYDSMAPSTQPLISVVNCRP